MLKILLFSKDCVLDGNDTLALDSSRAFFFGSRDRCHRPVSHFLWITALHLPSHLAKSRHGVFYFRLTFRTGGVTTERRISLRTKNPQEARFKALCLSGIMTVRKQEQQRGAALDYLSTAGNIAGQRPDSDFLLNLLHRVDRQRLAELAGLSLEAVNELLTPMAEPDTRRLDIEMPGGFAIRNVNSDEDMGRAVHILKAMNLSPEALAALITSNPNPARAAPVPASPPVAPQADTTEAGGTTIQEMVPRFAGQDDQCHVTGSRISWDTCNANQKNSIENQWFNSMAGRIPPSPPCLGRKPRKTAVFRGFCFSVP
ncbi:hypothetical protein ACI2UB_12955 [Ralstonia nicotianae]